MPLFIGTASWTVPKQHLPLFPALPGDPNPSHLARYAAHLRCAEVNSSFYRSHRPSTWERWAASTPASFRFAVKAPKTVTHTARLVNTGQLLLEFFREVRGLGEKLGPVLIQLPPKLAFDEGTAHEFFTTLRELHPGLVALEPRHPGWFTHAADQLLASFEVARVAADPPKGSEVAARPGGWPGLRYWRLHGSPRTYYSNYEDPWLQTFADERNASLQATRSLLSPPQSWVIFDNTALGHAAANAIQLQSSTLPKGA